MSIFKFFFRRQDEEPDRSAGSARERLQIVVAHDRAGRNRPDYLPRLQRDLIDVISRYVSIDPQKVQVKFGSDGGISTLEVDVELPQGNDLPKGKDLAKGGDQPKASAQPKARLQ